MKTEFFDYALPDDRISQHPRPRGESKLMVLDRATGAATATLFDRITDFVPFDSVLVLNNTKVFKARLNATDEKGRTFEVFLAQRVSDTDWRVLLKPKKKLRATSMLSFAGGVSAVFVDFEGDLIRFDRAMSFDDIDCIGEVPLPVYIKRHADTSDVATYQTVYAKHQGSIAAPTAGFHFTNDILKRLRTEKNVTTAFVTLHIGYGTFKPIKSEQVEDHVMLGEHYSIDEQAALSVNAARRDKRSVIAVGTSSVRTLESVADAQGIVKAGSGFTEIFIYPGYRFKAIDMMITNFHLPRSAPLMMVCALAGKELIHEAYAEAIKNDFLFYSYGDAMLIK
jgi:S-adenosylmethionine:tRNA ribosyltransferase-isomerase